MASLVGQQLKDTYDSLLKTSDNDALGGTYKEITDGSGNGSGLYLGTGGRVGIGETSPSSALTVKSDEGALFADASGTRFIDIIPPKTANSFVGEIGTRSSHNLVFNTVDTPRMTIDTSGNVGIGTTDPQSIIHVSAPKPTYTDSGIVFRGGTTNNNSHSGISLISAGDALAGFVGSNFFVDGSTNSQSNTSRSSGYIHFANTTTVGKTSDIIFGGLAKGSTTSTERMRIDSSGNLLIGTTATPTSSAGNIVLKNGTAPTGNATDGVILYAEDFLTSSELKVRDEAGNVTTLSPHNFSLIPDGASEPMAWAYYSERDGKKINVDMLKLARMVESLTGEKLVYEQ